MTQFTEVIRDDQNATIAYIHPPKPTWRERGEHHIETIRDWYDTWYPRTCALAALLWLTTIFHR